MKAIKKRSKSLSKYTPSTILSLGHYDIDYTITLSEEDALKYRVEDVTQLNSVEDISFIIENQYLWEKIQMKTENNSINLLLYLNKISLESNKYYIEYIAFEKPVFYNDSVKLMLKTVNDFNFFFVNNCALNPESKKYFSLTVKYKDKESVISFDPVESEEHNKNVDNEIQSEGSTPVDPNDEAGEVDKDIQNKKKGENPFDKIKLDCPKYNYFISSVDTGLEINPFENFIEFVVYTKLNYGALITIDFNDVSESFTDKESMTLLNKLYLITDIFLFDEKDTLNNFKQHYEIFTKDNIKKKYFGHQNTLDNEVSSQNYNEDEKSQASSQNNVNNSFNINHYLNANRFSSMRKQKEMTEKDIFEYYRRTIACSGALSILNSKLGIFIDSNFSKVTFIEVPMNVKAVILSYDIKPYPKLSHTTVDLVELYKGNLRMQRKFFKNIFYAGILNKIFYIKRKNFTMDVLYSGYLTGYEILKRLLHFSTNEIPFPDNPKFYIVKINNNEVNQYVKKEMLNKKESKFVLDCTNQEKSQLKYYVPLFDYNLHEFFENKEIQKELANKGFINSKGFVNYDPYYGKAMGIPNKKLNNRHSSASSPHYLIQKQVEKNVKNLKNRILQNPLFPTNIKLPVLQCKVSEKVNNYNKIYGKKCSHSHSKKCQYCVLYERAKIEIDIEEEKRRQMQLRRYK